MFVFALLVLKNIFILYLNDCLLVIIKTIFVKFLTLVCNQYYKNNRLINRVYYVSSLSELV